MVEIEAAVFWRESPEIEREELKTEEIDTEVFFFRRLVTRKTTAPSRTRNGSCSGVSKRSILRVTARSDEWFMHQLALRLIAKVEGIERPHSMNLCALSIGGIRRGKEAHPKTEAVLAEINGW